MSRIEFKRPLLFFSFLLKKEGMKKVTQKVRKQGCDK
uniref:Uncharacterized protein n=1 Tax=Rhizophora mucronata TaxID=61149 RepID=A0A2P2QHX1_RHIMU